MRGRWTVVGFGCVAVAFAALGGCGGSDDSSDDGVSDTSEATAGDDADAGDDSETDDADGSDDTSPESVGDDDAATSDDADGSDGTAQQRDGDDGDGGDDDGDGDDAAGGGEFRCDDIFSMADVEAWFGEPAELNEDRMDSIGQIVCTWETIEDPTNADDLAFQLITAQIFTGEGVPAASFIDPEIFEAVTMIDDIGDLAFYEESFGRNYYFLDEPIAGSFSVSDVDMGAVDGPKRHTADEVDDLFRQFHARVTG